MKKFIIFYILNKEQKQCVIKAKNLYEARNFAQKSFENIISIEEYFGIIKHKIKEEEFIFILKDLNMVLKAGLSLQEVILEFARSNHDAHIAKIFSVIYNKLKNGSSYNEAFRGILNSRECAILKICDGKEDLYKAFEIIINLKEKNLYSFKQFKKAITYPLFVFICIILAFFVLMILVLPEFKTLFLHLELDLPKITQILFVLGDFFKHFYVFIILSVGFFITLACSFRKSLFFHKILFHFPVFGKIIFYQDKFCFFLIFSYLLKAGVDIKRAFELACEGIENQFFKNKMFFIKTSFESGLDLDQAFFNTRLFEPFVVRMLNLGLKSSKLDEGTYGLALFYEYKKENYIQRFLSVLEPLMTVFMAILILILALGVFLPMWQINQAF
ncbi:transformation system, type II secretion system membrane protein CtsF [Campylobacter subantarcticus LMG 24377]|uniref:Transformation system, type II secretion system membrane protein CtsF n=1 Tax=Campylobacter subantarcticus TaxID=497724 RepID=A0ABW9N371_9BACT|nr:transformation system, type II secretion system membrane protein CtsF [Campylobacter subantarcticus]AJC91970.1 transformation system, type II secretion system membrane protein CtsF [Campylobacter subantarcticus LMG 24377]EAL3939368.1 transformation system, type II secretion system membrane protein CtsF [Campylobacter lari]MPB98727.1 transformation system, type II secretion system membrane protein CtsF [Campylobacter subantarcticus]